MNWNLPALPSRFVAEDMLDRGREEAGEFEGQRQAGIETAGLNGVDGLAGDVEAVGEIGLAPATLSAEDAKAILHWALRSWITSAARAVMQKTSML